MSLEERIVEILSSARFHVSDEGELHQAVAGLLRAGGIEAEHEVKIGPRERIDFLAGDVGMEIKVGGTHSHIAAQLSRYAECSRVRVLLLLTPRMRYLPLDGLALHGKRVRVVKLSGGFL